MGITKVINNVVIDTGAAHSLLSSDVVEDIVERRIVTASNCKIKSFLSA